MDEKKLVERSSKGTFMPGHSGYRGQIGRIESYLKKNFRDNLPMLCEKMMDMIYDDSGVIRCSTKASLIKLAFEYAEGKPAQIVTIAQAPDDAVPADLTRLEMRARVDALDPVILELEESLQKEIAETEDYQEFLKSKQKKQKEKEKVVN